MCTFRRRRLLLQSGEPPRQKRNRTYRVPAHAFVVGTTGVVRAGSFRSSLFGWVKKLLSASFVAAMIATGVLLFTHFTQKWSSSGYPSIPINTLVGGTGQGNAQPGIPLGGRVHHPSQHQQRTQTRPVSNFAQYEG